MTHIRTWLAATALAALLIGLPALSRPAFAQFNPLPGSDVGPTEPFPTDTPAASDVRRTELAVVRLVASQEAIRPGDDFFIAVHWKLLREDVHAYGHDHDARDGDLLFGIPTSVQTLGPEGFTFDRPVYPVSHPVTRAGHLMREYKGEFSVLIPVGAPQKLEGNQVTLSVRAVYQLCDESACYEDYGPDSPPLELTLPVRPTDAAVAQTNAAVFNPFQGEPAPPQPQESTTTSNVEPAAAKQGSAEESFTVDLLGWEITLRASDWPLVLLLSIPVGLALNLTPCVLPIIPLTVGFFVHQSQQGADGQARRSRVLTSGIAFSIGLVATFAVLGAVVSLTTQTFSAIFDHPPVILGLGLFIILMALGMFGVYPVQLPASVNKLAGGRSGFGGALFMGVLAAVLSTPCTGPAIGAMIGLVALLPAALGITIFVGMGLGMAAPYLLLTGAPGLLDRTPRSGKWTETVKIGLGFVLLALGASVLSGLGQRFTFAIWSALGLSAVVWLAATVVRSEKMSSAGAWIVRLLLMAAAIYAISASWPELHPAPTANGTEAHSAVAFRPYSPAVMENARQAAQPVMIDFVTDSCTYCDIMDREVWPTQTAAKALTGITAVKANLSRDYGSDLRQKYGIPGQPALVVLDGNGVVVEKIFPVRFYDDPFGFAAAMTPIRAKLGLPAVQ